MRMYPEKIATNGWPESTALGEYTVSDLEVSDDGKILSGPTLDNWKDNFVVVRQRRDMDCLLGSLPSGVLRDLAYNRVVDFDGYRVTRPRESRDDVITFSGGARRKTCIYGIKYLTGNKQATTADIEPFLQDFSKFMFLRPFVGVVAKWFMWNFVNSDKVRARGIPQEVLETFYKYGRSGNMDASVVGTVSDSVKVDQKMSFLSAMSRLCSPMPNVFYDVNWVDDGKYNPGDSYGIYCIDCYVDETLKDTPVYKEIGGTFVPLVGKCEDVVVLKPTMDDLKFLEQLGLAKITKIKWSWRFSGGKNIHPYRHLYNELLQIRSEAKESSHFWKLVACALWGLTLQRYVQFEKGKPALIGGYWFNPIIGFTTTDLMRSINFRSKLRSQGKVGAEVVDMLAGQDGDWYDKDVYKVKGPFTYTHVGPLYHVAPEDDKLGLLSELRECRAKSLVRPMRSRYSFSSLYKCMTTSAAKELFGKMRDTRATLQVGVSKRKFDKDVHRLRLNELLSAHFEGVPYQEEEARTEIVQPEIDWNSFVLEMATEEGTLIDKMMQEGMNW